MLSSNNLKSQILGSIEDLDYVVMDKEGDIIDSSTQGLKLYRDFIINDVKFMGNCYYKGEYFFPNNNWYECSKKQFNDNLCLICFKNITKYKSREQDLQVDKMTGLPNANSTDCLIDTCIEDSLNAGEEFALVFADIDLFKTINDVYGHECGDLVLKKVGQLFLNNTRTKNINDNLKRSFDVVGRRGGDEFLFLLRNISCDNAVTKCRMLSELVSKMVVMYGKKAIDITMTFGLYHADKNNLVDNIAVDEIRSLMMRKADIAMYNGKKDGRDKVVLYDDTMAKGNSKLKVYKV
ncbi:MAG: GGDEF domain-containing protein [Bacilli bacterium]